MRLHLPDHETTEQLGRAVAEALLTAGPIQTILFEGTLGSGKTTLIRALVEALPGGDEAEVSSPSFNLYNLYPTQPETAHYDLYRLEGAPVDESLYEFMDDGLNLILIEWAEFLPAEERPTNWLLFRWHSCQGGRSVEITANGNEASHVRATLAPLVQQLIET